MWKTLSLQRLQEAMVAAAARAIKERNSEPDYMGEQPRMSGFNTPHSLLTSNATVNTSLIR
jgi:hypothetical protein